MTNQNLLITILIACSLGGWYVVLSKYLELRTMLKSRTVKDPKPSANTYQRQEPILNASEEIATTEPLTESQAYAEMPYDTSNGSHIPGFGPAPLGAVPFEISPETLEAMRQFYTPPKPREETPPAQPKAKASMTQETTMEAEYNSAKKRQVCNWASIIHLSGLMFVTGIPFLNIILPACLWLWIKEEHPYLARQGREVINFQITLSLIMFSCLFLGAFFVWLMPTKAQALFEWTKTLRIVFSTGMNLPYNIFTVIPFFWACIMVIRGAVAGYHGLAFRYPFAQPFLFKNRKPAYS